MKEGFRGEGRLEGLWGRRPGLRACAEPGGKAYRWMDAGWPGS